MEVEPDGGAEDVEVGDEDLCRRRELREAVEVSLAHAAHDQVREITLLQEHLHDDIAEFVYQRMRRRPMVLPVVVEL